LKGFDFMKIYRTFAIVVAIASMVGTILSTSANASGQTAIAQPSATVQQPLPTSSSGAVQVGTTPSVPGPAGIQLLNLTPVTGTKTAVAATTVVCTLYPDNIYLRQSFGYNGVGSKGHINCNIPVTSLSLTLTIQKLNSAGWLQLGSWATNNRNSSSLQSDLSAGVNCTNTKQTIWSAWFYATAVYQGVTYYVSASAQNGAQSFPCGT